MKKWNWMTPSLELGWHTFVVLLQISLAVFIFGGVITFTNWFWNPPDKIMIIHQTREWNI